MWRDINTHAYITLHCVTLRYVTLHYTLHTYVPTNLPAYIQTYVCSGQPYVYNSSNYSDSTFATVLYFISFVLYPIWSNAIVASVPTSSKIIKHLYYALSNLDPPCWEKSPDVTIWSTSNLVRLDAPQASLALSAHCGTWLAWKWRRWGWAMGCFKCVSSGPSSSKTSRSSLLRGKACMLVLRKWWNDRSAFNVGYRLSIEKVSFLCLSLLFHHQGTAEGSSQNLKTASWPRFSMVCWCFRAMYPCNLWPFRPSTFSKRRILSTCFCQPIIHLIAVSMPLLPQDFLSRLGFRRGIEVLLQTRHRPSLPPSVVLCLKRNVQSETNSTINRFIHLYRHI